MKDYDQIGNRDEWPSTSCDSCGDDEVTATVGSSTTESAKLSGGEQGPPGPPGKRGEKGDQGEKGDKGETGIVDYTAINNFVDRAMEQVWGAQIARMDRLESEIKNKVKSRWWEA